MTHLPEHCFSLHITKPHLEDNSEVLPHQLQHGDITTAIQLKSHNENATNYFTYPWQCSSLCQTTLKHELHLHSLVRGPKQVALKFWWCV